MVSKTNSFRRLTWFWVVLCGFSVLASCAGPRLELPPTLVPSAAVVLQRRSATPSPVQAESAIPTAAPTPGTPDPVRLLTPIASSSNPLDVESAAHLVELARWGMGMPQEMAWSPGCGVGGDGETIGRCWLALATTSGIYRFAFDRAGNLELEDSYEAALPVSSLAWSPGCALQAQTECWLAAGFANGGLRLWDAQGALQDEPAAVLQNGGLPLRSLAWSPECGKTGAACRLAAGAWDGIIYLWDLEGETLTVRELHSGRGSIEMLVFNVDREALLSWSPGELINAWDVGAGTVEDTAMGGEALARVAFSLDGTTAALIGSGGGLRVHDTGNGFTRYALSAAEIEVHNLTLTADGSLMAVQEKAVVRLRAGGDGRALLTLSLPGAPPVGRLALTPDGSWLAAAGPGGLWLWHIAGTQQAAELRVGRGFDRLALSADGNLLATWRETAAGVALWQLDEGSAVNTLSGMPLPPLAVAFSADCSQPEGCLLASAGDALRVWDAATSRRLHELDAESPGAEHRLTFYDPASGQTHVTTLRDQTPLASAAFSPDGSLVAAGAFDGTVRLWTLEDGQAAAALAISEVIADGEDGRVVQVVFSGDGSRIGGLTAGGAGAVWKMDSGALVGRFSLDLPDETPIDSVCYAAFEGDNLAVGWEGQTLLIDPEKAELLAARPGWCGLPLTLTTDGLIETGEGLLQLEGAGEDYARRKAVAAAPQAGRIVIGYSGSGGSLVQVWNLTSVETTLLQTSPQPLAAEDAVLLALAAHDGGALSLAAANGRLRRFELPAGTLSETLLEMPFKGDDRPASFAFSPDGSQAAAGSDQGAVALWSGLFAEGETPAVQTLRAGPVGGSPAVGAAFSPNCGSRAANGCRLAVIFDNRLLLLWALDGSDPVSFEVPAAPLELAFAPDGGSLAVTTEAGIHMLHLADGVWGQIFPGHAAQFSPLGDLAVAGGGLGSKAQIALYDVETGVLIKTLAAGRGALAFSPDGQLLAVSGLEVDLWDIGADPPLLLERLPNLAPYSRITFSENGAFLILADWDGRLRIWGLP